MQETDTSIKSETQEETVNLYSAKQYQLATFLGGPIASALMFYKDLKALGEKKKALSALNTFLGLALVIAISIYTLNEDTLDMVPAYIIPAIYTIFASIAANKYFSNYYKQGYEKRSNLNTAKNGLIGAVIFIAMLFVPAIVLDGTLEGLTLKSKTFGHNNTVYYEREVKEEYVSIVGRVLIEEEVFSVTESTADVVLKNSDDKLAITFFIIDEYMNDNEVHEYYKQLGAILAKELKKHLVVHLSSGLDEEPAHSFEI